MSPSPADATFRRLEVTDAADFLRLRLAAITEHPEYFGAPAAEEAAGGIPLFEKRIRGFQDGDAAFGAFLGDEMVGITALFRAASGTMRHRGEMWGVYVAPKARGTDVAEGLIRALIAHARQYVDVLTGHVTTTNLRAKAFYDRLGFSITGVERKILKVNGRHFDQELLILDFTDSAD